MSRKQIANASPECQGELIAAIDRLTDQIEILTTAVESLCTEIQWQNNERSQDYREQHLPLVRLPLDPAARDWRPTFGCGQPSPVPNDTSDATRPRSSRLFD